MTGPPTPPPTTAVEIADEARTSAPVVTVATEPITAVPAAPAAPKQGSSQDAYQLLFPTLANLAYQGDYRQIIDAAERGDLKV
jgi:COP9 signalosome complex subunit 8